MSFKIIPTPPFERELKQLVKKYPAVKKDIAALVQQLLLHPQLGVSLGNNCYKIRMAIAGKGRGKSGGARIITYVQVTKENIFLLAIYDKAEMGSITDKELIARLSKIK